MFTAGYVVFALVVFAEQRIADFTLRRCLVDELVEGVEGGLLSAV